MNEKKYYLPQSEIDVLVYYNDGINKNKGVKIMALSTGDVIEVRLEEEIHLPPEDEEKTVIDPLDYKRDYNIVYHYPDDSGFADVTFSEDVGCISFCDIEDYLENFAKQNLDEVDEFEIFDVQNHGDSQTAKIRVKSVKG